MKTLLTTIFVTLLFSACGDDSTNKSAEESGHIFENNESINLERKNTLFESADGLIWQDNIEAKSIQKNYSEAITYCQNLELSTYNDWYLPSISQLATLHFENPLLRNIATLPYLSSTSDSTNAQFVKTFDTDIEKSIDKNVLVNIRCVRSDIERIITLDAMMITHTPATAGKSVQLTAVAFYSDGSKSKITPTWSTNIDDLEVSESAELLIPLNQSSAFEVHAKSEAGVETSLLVTPLALAYMSIENLHRVVGSKDFSQTKAVLHYDDLSSEEVIPQWRVSEGNYSLDKEGVLNIPSDVKGDINITIEASYGQFFASDSFEILGRRVLVKTGQITSYEAFDDGYYQLGEERRYIRDDNLEVVLDDVRHLMWQDFNNTLEVNVPDAHIFCNESFHAGFDNWRLPRFDELINLTDKERVNPSIDSEFKFTIPHYYWSSSELQEGNEMTTWAVYFNDGYENNINKDENNYHIRCVRED
jgi:hypothetical protein